MCDKAILEYSGTLNSVPDCYKNQEITLIQQFFLINLEYYEP